VGRSSHSPIRLAGSPPRAGLDQEAKDMRPRFLCERGQGDDGISLFHISSMIEFL
jgi:hypothetical protein